jgi:hypothetical protein
MSALVSVMITSRRLVRLNRPGSGGGLIPWKQELCHVPKYPNQLYEQAQHIVATAISQDPALSLNGAVIRIGPRVGVVPDTLRG